VGKETMGLQFLIKLICHKKKLSSNSNIFCNEIGEGKSDVKFEGSACWICLKKDWLN
jgi:hypothetical protein